MDLPEIQKVLCTWAAKKPLIKNVYVFGSRVRGTQRQNSDLDIAIELDHDEIPSGDVSGGMATWMFVAREWRNELATLFPFKV